MHSPSTRDGSTVAGEQVSDMGGSAAAAAPCIISIVTSPGEAGPVPCSAMLTRRAGSLQGHFYLSTGVRPSYDHRFEGGEGATKRTRCADQLSGT